MIQYKKLARNAAILFVVSAAMTGCQKLDRPELGNYPKDPANPGGTLKFYTAFENTEVDSIKANFGTVKDITYVAGITGKAYKGSATGQIEYPSANGVTTSKSFSVSLWINTVKHDGGAQSVFMIPNTGDFWGNMFMLIEGNNSPTDNSMLIKFHFGSPTVDQWVVYDGANRIPDMYGAWKHLVFTYDAATSKFNIYVNGNKVAMPAGITDRKNGANPLGSTYSFNNVSKFIIGGYQQHIGFPSGTSGPETWMLHYTGMLDQFRFYSKALSDAEISALYASKQ